MKNTEFIHRSSYYFFLIRSKTVILFLGKHLFKRGAANTGSSTLLCAIPFRAFHTNFPANKPFQNIAKETCSPHLLSDFYKPGIRAVYNVTVNNDSFLLLATTKPVDNKNLSICVKTVFILKYSHVEC